MNNNSLNKTRCYKFCSSKNASAEYLKSSHPAFMPPNIQTPSAVIIISAKKRFRPFIIERMISFLYALIPLLFTTQYLQLTSDDHFLSFRLLFRS